MDREEFIRYLTEEKNASYNTCKAYERDVEHFAVFLNKRDVGDLYHAVNADVVSYLMELKMCIRDSSVCSMDAASDLQRDLQP